MWINRHRSIYNQHNSKKTWMKDVMIQLISQLIFNECEVYSVITSNIWTHVILISELKVNLQSYFFNNQQMQKQSIDKFTTKSVDIMYHLRIRQNYMDLLQNLQTTWKLILNYLTSFLEDIKHYRKFLKYKKTEYFPEMTLHEE